MRRPLIILFLLLIAIPSKAQHLNHDVGLFVGIAVPQTDYHQAKDPLSKFSNTGKSISLTHYLQFYNKSTRWNADGFFTNHIMLKSELNFVSKPKLRNSGKYTEGNGNLAQILRAMKGSFSVISLGIQAEYYFKDLKEYMHPYSYMKWNPYVTFGFQYAMYNNTLTSDLGDWTNDPMILPSIFNNPNDLAIGSGGIATVVFGGGVRYKLSKSIDLAGNFICQHFLSDAVDGLQSSSPKNKNNDYFAHAQIGIIYHLKL